ncbi:hypothetical protein IKQ26_08955 [bacterium]|nr:hypothetical protein [bacterium]
MTIANITGIGKNVGSAAKGICRSKGYQKLTEFALENISPAEQRLLVGVTGVIMQPWIDLHNKKVDKETRIYSACKNCAKAFVGATTGFFIRKGCIKLVNHLIDKGRLLPSDTSGIVHYTQKVKNYGSALGTGLAIVVMMATNFLLDAPLTQLLSSKIYSKATGGKDKQ